MKRTLAGAAGGICAAAMLAGTAGAQTYSWIPWTQSDFGNASFSLPGFGSGAYHGSANTNVSVNGAVQFSDVPFTPTLATGGLGVLNPFVQSWWMDLDLMGIADTSTAVIGLGNFAHNLPDTPGYRLEAFDRSGSPMELTGFTQLGSYNHSWPFLPTLLPFNDDVALDTSTGLFTVTGVPGVSEVDSDIALLTLPAGVGRLRVSSLGPSGNDIVNVMISPIPAPGGGVLLGLGGVLAARRRR